MPISRKCESRYWMGKMSRLSLGLIIWSASRMRGLEDTLREPQELSSRLDFPACERFPVRSNEYLLSGSLRTSYQHFPERRARTQPCELQIDEDHQCQRRFSGLGSVLRTT